MSFGQFHFENHYPPEVDEEEARELAATLIQRSEHVSRFSGQLTPLQKVRRRFLVTSYLAIGALVILVALRIAPNHMSLEVPEVPLWILVLLVIVATPFLLRPIWGPMANQLRRQAVLQKAHEVLGGRDLHGATVVEYRAERGTVFCTHRRVSDGGVFREWSVELNAVHLALLGQRIVMLFASGGHRTAGHIVRIRDPSQRRDVERALAAYETIEVLPLDMTPLT
jgi:hypothetical protein